MFKRIVCYLFAFLFTAHVAVDGYLYYTHKDWLYEPGEYLVSPDHARAVNGAFVAMFMQLQKLMAGAGCT